MTNNKSVLNWIEEMKALVNPDNVVWIDGSEEQLESLRAQAVSTGELIKLNEEKLPGCYLHRTAVNDVARVEDRTFICTKKEEDAGPINNWMDPEKSYKMLYDIARGSYAGRTMYVIPYSMGPVGSPFSKIGVELTDSIYVVCNMAIMTRVGQAVLDALGDSEDWVRGLHCKCQIDAEKRYICHFPEDNTIISVNSGYGGNVLLGKKCFALRIASFLGRKEGWMAEHMLILGIENPQGEIKYIAAAFPSACGKTNLAMLIPPKYYKDKGYKVWCVGDDIAWMRIGPDGRLWAINPENGFFVGSIMASETTAAATGAVGVVRRDPMAMRPFCGYHMGDYFGHWLEMGEKLGDKAPKIFNVNWFRTDDEGHFIWPGFGDNLRVLEWILKRCENKVGAQETAIGYVPYAEDINLEGLDLDIDTLKGLLEVDKDLWKQDAEGIKEFYAQFGDRLPQELRNQLNTMVEKLG